METDVIPKEELIKTLRLLSRNKEVTSDPAWEEIKAGLESAIKGPLSVWKMGSKIK